jgi:hypothetical protein
MKTVSVLAFLAATAVNHGAHAEKPRAEVSVLAGYGTGAFDNSDNNFGFGAGFRVGASFGAFWLGGTATYHFGSPDGYNVYDSSGAFVPGDHTYGLSTLSAGGELGFNVRLFRATSGTLLLRPYAWVGTNVYVPSVLSTFTPDDGAPDPIVRFVIAPSVHVDYELARTGIFFGADVRVNLLVPGKAPLVNHSWAYDGWRSGEEFTAELSIYGVIGKRF